MVKTVPTNPIYRDKRRRVWELDFLRGLAVIAMCFDHLMCDFVYLPWWFGNFNEVNNAGINRMCELAKLYWQSDFRFFAHHIFVFLFLFLVGTSCAFSRDNTRRGTLLLGVAVIFSCGSFVLKKFGVLEDGIIFGILDCIAFSILIAASVDELTKPIKPLNVFLPLALGMAVLIAGVCKQFWTMKWDRVLDWNKLTDYAIGTAAFGDDWFGIFPNVGGVLMGLYWGKAAYGVRASLAPRLDGKWNKPFRFVGRHALIFYILHQGALSGIVMLVCTCLGYK